MAKTSLSDLRMHLFETIERLKANDDTEASKCEKINPQNAKLIIEASKAVVESAKAEFIGINILKNLDRDMRDRFTNPLGLENGAKQ